MSDLTPRPRFVRTLNELEEENPELAKFMKRHATDRFFDCGVAIGSLPEDLSGPVIYGFFVVDRREVEKSHSTSRIKQDFVVFDPRSGKTDYYSGRRKGEPEVPKVKTIAAFCARFGMNGSYGCERQGSKWICRDHHYTDDQDPSLPEEETVRRLLSAAIEVVRNELRTKAPS